jgi:hypothetical protein
LKRRGIRGIETAPETMIQIREMREKLEKNNYRIYIFFNLLGLSSNGKYFIPNVDDPIMFAE